MATTAVDIVVKVAGGQKLDSLQNKLDRTKTAVNELQDSIKKQGAANSLLKQKLTALTSAYSKLQAGQKKLAATEATDPKAKFKLQQQTEKLRELKKEIDKTKASLRSGLNLNIKGKRDLDILQEELRQTQAEFDKTANKARGLRGAFRVSGEAAANFGKRLGGLRSQLVGLGTGAALGRSFIDASDLESANTRIDNLVKNFSQFAGIQDLATQSAQKFRLSQADALSALTNLGNRLGSSGASLEDLKNIYEGLNTLLVVNKSSAQEAASATLQLSQALGSGRLAGEEFNAISEATPQLLEEVARVLGVQRGELKKLGSEGKISSQVLIQALKNIRTQGAADLEGAFSGSFGALRDFNVALKEFSTTVGQELLPVITPLLKEATKLLKLFGELPEPVKKAAVGITLVGTAAVFAIPLITATAGALVKIAAAIGTLKLGAAAAGVSKLALAFVGLKAAILATPFVAAAAAIGGLAALTVKYYTEQAELNRLIRGGSDDLREYEAKISELETELTKASAKLEDLRENGISKRKAL